MNESEFARKVVAHFRSLPGLVCFKHADRFTVGVPDISTTWSGRTFWWELKSLKRGVTAPERVKDDMLQLATMVRLEQAGNNAWYMIWNGKEVEYWRPTSLMQAIQHSQPFVTFHAGPITDTLRVFEGKVESW